MMDFFAFIVGVIQMMIVLIAFILCVLIGFITFPLWIIPYLIYKAVNGNADR